MEKIDRINFLNIGFVDGNGEFFDHLKPGGVAILFGEENNFICYYKNDEKIQSIEKVEKIDAFDDFNKIVSDYFNNAFDIEDKFLVEGLVKCTDEEDDYGLYDYIEKHGGEVFFEKPNSEVFQNVHIFFVKQQAEGEFQYDQNKLFIGNNEIVLKDLSSGHFDDNDEVVVFWKK